VVSGLNEVGRFPGIGVLSQATWHLSRCAWRQSVPRLIESVAAGALMPAHLI